MVRRFGLPTLLVLAFSSVLLTGISGAGASNQLANFQASPEATPCAPTSDADAEALAYAFQDTLVTGDVSGLDQILAPDYVHHWAHGEDAVGIEAHAARVAAFSAAYDDYTFIEQIPIVAEGYVTMLWTATGIQVEPYGGIAPSGVEETHTGINVYRVECGLIVESWSELGLLGSLIETGVITDEELASVGTPTP